MALKLIQIMIRSAWTAIKIKYNSTKSTIEFFTDFCIEKYGMDYEPETLKIMIIAKSFFFSG